MKERKCTFCHKYYPLNRSYFNKVKTIGFHGFTYRCRLCSGKRDSLRYIIRSKKMKLYMQNNRLLHKQKWDARTEARAAVKKGIIKKLPCCICGSIKTEAHHPDYAKPLNVIWFCHKHHMQSEYKLITPPKH